MSRYGLACFAEVFRVVSTPAAGMECAPVLRAAEMVHAAEWGEVWIWRKCGVVGCQCCSVEVVQNALKRGSILYEYRIHVVIDP